MHGKTDNRNYKISQIIVKYIVNHNLINWSSFEILEVSENNKRNIRNNYKYKSETPLDEEQVDEQVDEQVNEQAEEHVDKQVEE